MFYFVLLVYYSIAFDSTFTYFFSYGIESQIFDSSRKRKTKQDPPKKTLCFYNNIKAIC